MDQETKNDLICILGCVRKAQQAIYKRDLPQIEKSLSTCMHWLFKYVNDDDELQDLVPNRIGIDPFLAYDAIYETLEEGGRKTKEKRMSNYDEMTNNDFDRILVGILEESLASELISIPGVYEAVSEFYNNEVLERWDEEKQRKKE